MFEEEEVTGDQALPGVEPPTPPNQEADDVNASDEEFLNQPAKSKPYQVKTESKPAGKIPFVGNGIGSGNY